MPMYPDNFGDIHKKFRATPNKTYRTAITTRNGMPNMTANGIARTGTAASANLMRVLTNNSPYTAQNISIRALGFGYDVNLAYWSQTGTAITRGSLEVGGTRYQITQNGSSTLTFAADTYTDFDIIRDVNGNPVSLPGGASAKLRFWCDISVGNYIWAGMTNGSVLMSLGEYYTGLSGTSSAPDRTAVGDNASTSNTGGGGPFWLIGDMPVAAKSALTIDDSKGRGIIEQNNPGNNSDYGFQGYTADAKGNQGLWDRLHAAQGMNGINLSLPTSKLAGWSTADLSKLKAALTGLSFSHLEYGLFQNDLNSGATASTIQSEYATLHAQFSPFLLPGGDITAREMSPSANDSVPVTGTTYSGTTGVDSITNAQAVALSAAYNGGAGLTVIKKAGANQAGFVGIFPIVGVDTTANTVSYTVASGLTTPTTFGTMSSLFATTVFQVPGVPGYDVNRQNVNAMVNAKTLIPGQTQVVSLLAYEQTTNASGQFVWRVDGTRQKNTADGVHETSSDYQQVVALNTTYGYPAASIIAVPTNYRWTPSFNLYLNTTTAVYYTNINTTSYIPSAPDFTYYVNLTSGVDSAAGTLAAPWLTLNKAVNSSTAGKNTVVYVTATADTVLKNSKGWNNVIPAGNLFIINVTPQYRIITASTVTGAAITFTQDTTYSNVYSIPYGASTFPQGIMDTTMRETPINPATGLAVPNVPTAFKSYIRVADKATCSTTPFSYYVDSANAISYINANGRNLVGDTQLLVSSSTNGGRICNVSGAITYVDGLDFVGGATPMLAQTGQSGATAGGQTTFDLPATFIHRNCTFQGSGNNAINTGGSNGLAVLGPVLCLGYRSGAYYNFADGFNYHSGNSVFDETSPFTNNSNSSPNVLEDQCCSYGNGTTGSLQASQNASTIHDWVNIIRLNSVYPNSGDTPIGDVFNAMSWMLGITCGPPLRGVGTGNICNIGVGNNVMSWLDGCTIVPGPGGFATGALAPAKLYYRNMAPGMVLPTVQSSNAPTTY